MFVTKGTTVHGTTVHDHCSNLELRMGILKMLVHLHCSESRWRNPSKGGLVRGHDKPIHGGCAIYFPGGVRRPLGIFLLFVCCSMKFALRGCLENHAQLYLLLIKNRWEWRIHVTLPETNIAPEKDPGKWDSYWKPSIFRCYVSFRGVNPSFCFVAFSAGRSDVPMPCLHGKPIPPIDEYDFLERCMLCPVVTT